MSQPEETIPAKVVDPDPELPVQVHVAFLADEACKSIVHAVMTRADSNDHSAIVSLHENVKQLTIALGGVGDVIDQVNPDVAALYLVCLIARGLEPLD